MSWMTFMIEAVRDNKTTGAFGPSSRALADAITDLVDLKSAKTIVEYGPGEGVFTEAILRKKSPDSFFVSLEVLPSLVEATRKRCPGVNVVQDSAENAIVYLREAGYENCDAIVSGLPWARFPEELQDRLLDATFNVLAPGGRFVTFAYAMSPVIPSGRRFFSGKMPARFGAIRRFGPVWKNLPPCFVYMATKPK